MVPILLAVGTAAAVVSAQLTAQRLWNGDSGGYIDWAPYRTPGYPAFLAAIALVSPEFGILRIVQSACLLLATVFLCWSVARIVPGRWLPVLLGCAILLFPPLWQRAGQIRPDIPFISLVELFFGASACAFATHQKRWSFMAGAALGLAILFRPVGYALLGGLLFIAIGLARRQGSRAVVALVAPLVGILAATSVANGVLRGYYAPQAFAGFSLLGKSAPLIPVEGFGDPMSARVGGTLGGLHEAAIRAQGPELFWISQQTYIPVLWEHLIPLLVASSGCELVTCNRIAADVARRAIARDPWGYARLVAVHLEGMWTLPWITTRDRVAPIAELLRDPALQVALGDTAQSHEFVELLVPEWVYVAKLAALACLFGLCCALPLLALIDGFRDPRLVLGAAVALSVHAYNLTVAATDLAFGRLALPLIPMLALALVLAVPPVVRAVRRQIACALPSHASP